MEFLWKAVEQNRDINGIKIDNNEIKMVQHADDTTLTLNDTDSLLHALNTIESFSKVSGLQLHIGKTAGILLGNLRDTENKIHGVTFPKEPIKCLGVYIGHNKNECENLNWKPKIEDMQKLFESWKKRKLTLFGKVQIINTLAISKFVYNFTILDVPKWAIDSLKKDTYNFLWKRDFIKRTTIIGKVKDGGLGLTDIDTKIASLKASWVTRLLKCQNSWRFIPNFYINLMGFETKDFIKANSTENINAFKFSMFYKSVFEAFFAIKDRAPINLGTFSEIVWLNNLFKWKNNVLFFENWIKTGFVYVKDFYDMNGKFVSEQNVYNKLMYKRNWIQEYMIIRSVLQKTLRNVNTIYAKYTNIKHRYTIVINGCHQSILDKKAKFVYDVLIEKKKTRPINEKKWCENFNSPNQKSFFQNIYIQKILDMPCKLLSELNFKIIHNILSCGYMVNKWNLKVGKMCIHCKQEHTLRHMLYDCKKVEKIWKKVSCTLRRNITWKIIVIGFNECNDIHKVYNVVIAIICKSIHQQWSTNSENQDILKEIKYLYGIIFRLKLYYKLFIFVHNNSFSDKIGILVQSLMELL